MDNYSESVRPQRIVLIGAGKWMRSHHLPVVRRLEDQGILEIAGIWNRTKRTAVELAEEYQVSRVYDSLNEVTDDASLDGAVVCVSREAVYGVVARMRNRALPLLVEKPPGNSSEEGRRLAELIGDRAIVGFNRRYAPVVERFRTIALENSPVHYVDCQFTRTLRTDPRFVSETGIHGINLLEWLLGPVTEVVARAHAGTGTRNRKAQEVYHWQAMLTFDSGSFAHVSFLPRAGFSGERYTAYMQDRTVVLDYGCHFCDDTVSRISVYDARSEKPGWTEEYAEKDRFKREGFINEYNEFIELMRRGTASRSTLDSSWNSLRVCEEIESASG